MDALTLMYNLRATKMLLVPNEVPCVFPGQPSPWWLGRKEHPAHRQEAVWFLFWISKAVRTQSEVGV